MNNEKSYTELMKACLEAGKNKTMNEMLDMYITMVFNEAWLQFQKRKLEDEINISLEERDQTLFMKLSSQYKEITEKLSKITSSSSHNI